ncbi:MAG TPA: dihydrolipoamide acetyltransferase family protein [Candidatus Limnocylindria bacterium]|nr:dihydrolipoamide acetyltransferase family protein [Candidatus Limnocylindria bacterium]
MATTIKMPQLGESVTEGTIERWLVKEGDTVAQYDPLFEVVTDKVNAEVPAEVAGVVTRILVGDGQTVKVGTPLAEIDDGSVAAVAAPPAAVPEPVTVTVTVPTPMAESPAAPAVAVVAAPVAPQDEAAAGRMTPAVRRLVREHGLDVRQIRGSGVGGRVTREDVLAFVAGQVAAPAAVPPASVSPAPAQAAAPATPSYTPPAPVPAPVGGDTEVMLTQMRKGIAAKMTRVKQTVPHAYTVVEVDMHNVVRWREANQAAYKAREGIGISYVAAVIKAVTETLRQHPTLNSQFAEDRVILKQAMNIGIAVAVDNGLLVPVIHNADQLSVSGVNHRIQDLAARARINKLKLDEIQGGTFTVNNTGWFGSVSSMPIVNAPEVAILSMEAIVKRPVVVTIEGEDVITIRPMMNMTCSFDHRVLDGAQVGAFMADVRKRLEAWDPTAPIG